MDVALSGPYVLGIVLLPLLLLLLALCLRCRDPQSSATESFGQSTLKTRPRECTEGPSHGAGTQPWPELGWGRDGCSQAGVQACPQDSWRGWGSESESALHRGPVSTVAPHPPVVVLSHPNLKSPQPTGGSHRAPSSRQDSDGADSVASYENQGPHLEAKDDDEDHNGGYLVVLPDNMPASGTAVQTAPSKASKPGFRDSAVSVESGDDYVNVQESEESAEASLDGSREYVNVSQELQPTMNTEPATPSSHEAEVEMEDEEEEDEEEQKQEEDPADDDYENL